jgi:hypothetical protein
MELGRAEEAGPMFEEARGIFERLDARPWLERLGRQEEKAASVG